MAITVNFNGASLRKPGAYSKTTVNLTGGFPVAATGIVGIVGESEAGAPTSAEDIRNNFFSAAQMADVVEKYKSGPLVDAFRLLISPSNDARVANGANRVYVYKTNISTQASGSLLTTYPTTYGTIESRNYGLNENTISFQVTAAQAEAGPAFANFNIMTDQSTDSSVKVRVNGGAAVNVVLPATTLPSGFVSIWNGAVTGILAAGGTVRGIGVTGATLTLGSVSGLSASLVISGTVSAWVVAPTVGDTLYIGGSSVIKGATNYNRGSWLVTAVGTASATILKLSDTLVLPEAATGTISAIPANDAEAYAPVSLTYTATTPAGIGAAVEIFDGAASVSFLDVMSGGYDRGAIPAVRVTDGSTLGAVIASGVAVFTISTSFGVTATAGDIVRIRPDSILKGASSVNVGNYLVTSATASTITATKISGTPTSTVTATDILAITDLEVFKGIVSTSAAPLAVYSGTEAKRLISLARSSDDSSEDSVSLGGIPVLAIGYDGTTAFLTISSTYLTVARAGGSGVDLSVKLSDYSSIQSMVDYIDAQTDYSAAVLNNVYGALAPTILDQVGSTVNICEENPGTMPGRIKKDSYDVQSFFDNSVLCELTRTAVTGTKGLPTVMAAPVFLTGAAKGGTTAASISAGIDEMQKVRINSLVPLFSRDATADILEELTEPSSTYQIAAVNAAALSHCVLMSNTLSRSERNAYCSIKDSWVNSKVQAADLASARVSLVVQDVKTLKTDGTLDWVQPWGLGCVAAGMQAGAPIGEPMTFKFINISGLTHVDFDPQTEADDAIDSGILFAEQPEQGGFRIVLGNTTYGKDANFVYNRISVMYAADSVAYNLRKQLEAIFVGVGLATASAGSIKNTCIQILATFLAAGMIVGDDTNGGTGYKNLAVTISGNIANISVTITPVQGIDFVLPSIVLDNIRQTA